ncbi:MAG: hypothetical protein JO362_24550 [Streptomycetaceae bacterium]|nr:hypothetical protein [Streptomycetaceae bacterium]
MRSLPRPHTGEGAAVLGVLTLVVLEAVASATVPRMDRPIVAGALAAAATAAFILAAAVLHARRRAAHQAKRPAAETADEPWFTPRSLEGFPLQALRPLLLGPDAPSLNRLHTAWIFATCGHDAAWIKHHLDLPDDIVHALTDAAHRRGSPSTH